MTRRRLVRYGLIAAATLVAMCAGVYAYVTSGGMTARQTPSSLEAYVAGRLIEFGIPSADRARASPLGPTPSEADVAAGRDLYVADCAVCHSSDGVSKTQAGAGMFPPPAPLRGQGIDRQTDGALFFLIRNGIRDTGMPAWPLPEQDIWRLVAYLRRLPEVATGATPHGEAPVPPLTDHPVYAGSLACKACHAAIYDRWKDTRMANVVRDPREHPEAVLPDFAKPDPLLTFGLADVAFVYGSRWKQRYFKKVGDDYVPLPAQWDVTHKVWKPYFVKDDWWAPLYPPDNAQRPTGPLCDGCHSVNYDIETHAVTEWNVGCEKCHGPGAAHARDPSKAGIVSPARLDYVAASDTCIQCHSQGRPPGNPFAGRSYDWPVGFHVGMALRDRWQLEGHKLGETTFTHFADGTAHKNRMQGNDFVTSVMYTHGVTCFTCHDPHGSPFDGMVRKAPDALCLDCHGPQSPNGPHAPTLEAHSHHAAGSPGSSCTACHMPKIAQTLGDVNVRSHTFRFVTPAETDALKIPNACTACHGDKPASWAAAALRTWKERSPWRVAE